MRNKQKKEIQYHLINSGLAGSLVLLGSLTGGSLTLAGIGAALVAAMIVATTKFKKYRETQEREYSNTYANFL